jgi:general stress protein 26
MFRTTVDSFSSRRNHRDEGNVPMRPITTARTFLSVLLASIAILALANLSARAEISPRDQQVLSKAELIYVATIRKNGTQSKAAPVWFTTGTDNNSVLIQTEKTTWKAKRISRGSPVLVWIGTADGPAFIGTAQITSDSTIQNKILTDFRQKYFQNRVLGIGPSRAGFTSGERIAIKIVPARDLETGFTSNPGEKPPSLESSK